MKKLIIILFVITGTLCFGQFKNGAENIPSIKESMRQMPASTSIFGFINPDKFSISHSVNMSFSTFDGQSIMLGSYTGRMFYKFTDRLNIAVDASLVTSPYSSFGKQFSNSINGIYITRAQINYKISKDTYIKFQYYNPVGNNYSNFGYYGGSGYLDEFYNPMTTEDK